MTHSPTPAERLAIKTANAALLNSPDASVDIVATVVFALGSAQLLQSPETAAEVDALRKDRDAFRDQRNAVFATNEELLARVERIGLERIQTQNEFLKVAREADRLRARVAELEAAAGASRSVDEDPIAYSLTVEALHASSGAVIETQTEPLVEPNGCGLCGIPKPHGQQWTAAAGLHAWAQPTQEQIKERMRRRPSVTKLRGLPPAVTS